jgi:putative ABC transport system permease protein
MGWRQELRYVAGRLDRRRAEAELDEEIRTHLEIETEQNIESGMSPEEARYAALRAFGNVALSKEDSRTMWGLRWFETLWQDVRFGSRTLLKNPGFTAVAVLTLALGVGANTAIFSVVNAVLLKSLPYPAGERLLTARGNMSLPDLDDALAQARGFEAAGGMTRQGLDYTGDGEPVLVEAAFVTHELFDVLGAKPLAGRTLTSGDNVKGGERVAVLSYGFWQRQLGGADIKGLTVPLTGQTYAVVGVLPASFTPPSGAPDVWIPLRVGNPTAADVRGVHFLRTFFRLRPGVSPEQAQAEMDIAAQRLAEAHPDENKGRVIRLMPLQEYMVGDVRPVLLILFGAVGFVLLIACANFANLLLARSAARRQEVALRSALGAGRGRLVRQLLTESVLLALAGGAAGLVLALWGVAVLRSVGPASLPRLGEVVVDWRVLAFTLGVSLLTGVVFGLAPAWQALRVNLNDALKEGGRGEPGGPAGGRMSGVLVAVELALALVLLIGAGLLVKGFWLLRGVEPGFDPRHLLTMRVELPEARYKEIPPQTEFRRRVLEELNSLPGTEAAMVSELPLGGSSLMHNFVIEGRHASVGDEPELYSRSVGGDYFRLMRIPLRAGRGLSPQDTAGAPLVGVVNEAFAREYFPGANAVGARVRWARAEGPPQWITIVGVAGDVKHFGLDQPEAPAIYTPYAQSPQPWKRWMFLVVRSESDPAALAGAVKARVWSVDPRIPLTRVLTMEEVAAASVEGRRFQMTLLGVFALVSLLLAAVGVYGLVSYSVGRRAREIGIRMALGARRRDIFRLVVRQGLLLASVGLVAGLAVAFALTRLLAGLVYGVSPTDPLTYAALSLCLLLVALVACLVPARRATSIDPLIALRYE